MMNNTLEYKGYLGSVEFNAGEGVLYGQVQGVNDIVTFEGKSVDELKSAFREAVDDYLETCKELGKTPDRSYKGTFNVRVGSQLHKAAVLTAKQHGIALNEFVKRAIQQSLSVTHKKEGLS